MTVGIPRAFLYHRYGVLWENFFENLNVKTVVSPPTNKEIYRAGVMSAIDEACLSSKIYLGHAAYLLDKCDCLFVPRIANFGMRDGCCTKFAALYDIVYNTFKDKHIKLLGLNVDLRQGENEMGAFSRLGRELGKKRGHVFFSYMLSKQAEKLSREQEVKKQEEALGADGLKILLLGHGYNVFDALIGEPIVNYLKELNAVPIFADLCDRKKAREAGHAFSDTLPWIYNKELLGAFLLIKPFVSGAVLMSAFPCGPDSLVNELIMRRVKDLPLITLSLDGLEAMGGVETRLESFIDIISLNNR